MPENEIQKIWFHNNLGKKTPKIQRIKSGQGVTHLPHLGRNLK
jgi:hypothetical protein